MRKKKVRTFDLEFSPLLKPLLRIFLLSKEQLFLLIPSPHPPTRPQTSCEKFMT